MGNPFEEMAAQEKQGQSNPQSGNPSVSIQDEPVLPVATDQRTPEETAAAMVNVGGQSYPSHGMSQDQVDAATIPQLNGNPFEQMAAQDEQQKAAEGKEAEKKGQESVEQKPTRVGHMPRAGEVWGAINEPIIPRGHISKALGDYATSSPTKFSMNHPYATAALKGGSGAIADTMEFARSMTAPTMIATLELGEIAKAGGVLGKLAKATGLLAGIGFGTQGAINTVEGARKVSQEGLTPENTSQTLMGAAQVVPGVAAGLHPFEFANKPINEIKRPGVKVTPTKVAGVQIPKAEVVQPERNLTTKIAEKLTTPGKTEANLRDLHTEAERIHAEETKPAARRATISTLSQVATDKIAAHDAISKGLPAPEEITGTDTPGQHLSPDEIWRDMQETSGKTWDKAREASARDTEVWQRQKTAAEQSHQAAIDHYNDLVSEHNADPANADNQMEPQVFNPEEVDAPEKPKTYDELKAEVDAARERTGRNNPTDIRQKARDVEVPKAEKALDQWFKEHESDVSSTEYQSAKQLWADSERFKEIAKNLRGKFAKGTLNGNDIRGLEAVVDGRAVTRRGKAGLGEFRRLVGPEAMDNLKNVAEAFDPLDKADPRAPTIPSWGMYALKHAASLVLFPFFGGIATLGVEGGNALLEMVMNHVMFDPEFGSTFKQVADATKTAMETGSQVPVTLAGKFRDMLLGIAQKYKESKLGGEEGAVGAAVKRKNVGPTAGDQTLNPERKSPTGTPLPKSWPTDDKLVEKYGEASDPAQTAFLLTDGRKVKLPAGSEHDRMLGGKPTDDFRTPYINESGNIRMRAYGVYGDRQFGFSLPKEGITEQQLKEILKWGPQLRTGRVFLEQADPEGKNVVLHNATNEKLEEGIRSIVPVKESPKSVTDVANAYNKAQGRPEMDTTQREPDSRRAQIADAFDAMKHDPNDPKVKESYEALINEAKAQKKHLEANGYKFDRSDKDPYTSYEQMRDDVKNNKHLSVWTGGNELPEDHPLGKVDAESGWKNNEIMRGVHDVMGHVAGDNDFSEKGEENAYNLHKQAFSEQAIPALTTETKGQTSWFWNNKDVRSGKAAPGEFPEQRAGILPEHLYTDDPVKGIVSATNTNGGATYNPTKGDLAGTDAYAVPMHPELSRTSEGTTVTPERVKSYLSIPGVKEALINDPELSVGTWVNDGKVYFDLSKAIPDRAEAIRLGNENHQKAITYLKNFEEIPLDNKAGTGTPIDDLASKEIATRIPTTKKADLTNNPDISRGVAAINEADKNRPTRTVASSGNVELGVKQTIANALAGYEGSGLKFTPEELANPDAVIEKAVEHYKGNLKMLYEAMPAAIRDVAHRWYDSAHELSKKWADQYGLKHEQVAGVIAALSPKNPWDNNAGVAERLIKNWKESRNHAWSKKMDTVLTGIANAESSTPGFRKMLNDIRGKKYSQLSKLTDDPAELRGYQGLWLRMVDEAHGSDEVPLYSPDGEVRGSTTRTWGMPDPIAKAIDILENGDIQHIHEVMGGGNKIRNFYNNIINPNSERGHVTIDTHAVGAAHLKPFSQDDVEVKHNFGGTEKGTPGAGSEGKSGMKGSYHVYEEAYRRAAKELGIQPRELQSITWEGIRSLVSDADKKNLSFRNDIDDIWREHEEGKLSLRDAREKIIERSGGFKKPEWATDEQWNASDSEFEPENMK